MWAADPVPAPVHRPVVGRYLCLSPLLPTSHLPAEAQGRGGAEPRALGSSCPPVGHGHSRQTRLSGATWWLPPAAAVGLALLKGQDARTPPRPWRLTQGLPCSPRPGMGTLTAPTPASCPQRLCCFSTPGMRPRVWVGDGALRGPSGAQLQKPWPECPRWRALHSRHCTAPCPGPLGHALTLSGPQALHRPCRRVTVQLGRELLRPAHQPPLPTPLLPGHRRVIHTSPVSQGPRAPAASSRRPGISGHLAGRGSGPT